MATKITYATLGGDSLEDLHRELDKAIAEAPRTFGREHLLLIDGKHLRSGETFDDRSPIDTSIVLGQFQKGTREHVKSAVSAARRAGATTGAWPGINPFGGWKASGSTGRGTGGPYYVQQFMREQSRVRIRGV